MPTHSRQPWSAEEEHYLAQNPHLSLNELAETLGRSYTAVSVKASRLPRDQAPLQTVATPRRASAPYERIVLPDSDKENTSPLITLEGPSVIWISDLHLPFHDARFIERVLELGRAWGVPDVIIGGDFLDIAAFSKFSPDPGDTLEKELSIAEAFIEPVSRAFRRVVYLMGNHEFRMLGKTLGRQLRSERFLRMFTIADNVNVTGKKFVRMNSREDDPFDWVLGHPENASMIAGRVPTMIGGRSETQSHVLTGHDHLPSWGLMEDGRRFSVASGMCADFELMFPAETLSTRPRMAQGAVIIKEGRPYLLGPFTDWQAFERLYSAAPPSGESPRIPTPFDLAE